MRDEEYSSWWGGGSSYLESFAPLIMDRVMSDLQIPVKVVTQLQCNLLFWRDNVAVEQ